MIPNLFEYHDYQMYLKDWLAHQRANQTDFSIAAIAKKAGISPSLLTMYFKNQRSITQKSLKLIAKAMGLTASEQNYLIHLWTISESKDRNQKINALQKLKKYQTYKKLDHAESRIFTYLSKWLNVSIRELAKHQNFIDDPEWIQQQLVFKASLQEIRESLKFLFENNFLIKTDSGKIIQKENQLSAFGEVFKVALSQFHAKMFELTIKSIAEVASEDRQILGHTTLLTRTQFTDLKKQMSKMINKYSEDLGKDAKSGNVFHISLSAIPLTKSNEIKKEVKNENL